MSKFTVSEAIDSFGLNKYSWKVFILVGIAMIFDGFDYSVVSYTMPQISAEWKLTSIQTGSLSSWSMIGLVIGGFISGILADRIGRKRTLVITVFFYSLFTIPIYFTNSFVLFAALRVMVGIGLGACIPISVTINSEYMPSSKRALFIGLGGCFMTLGWVLAGIIATKVIPVFGWRLVYLLGGIPFIYAILIHFAMDESMHFLAAKGRKEEVCAILDKIEKTVTGIVTGQWQPDCLVVPPPIKTASFSALFSKRYLRITIAFWLFYFMSSFIVYGVNSWLPTLLLSKGLGFGTSYGFAIAQNTAGVVAGVLAGILTSVLGRKRGIIVGFAASVVSITLMAFIGTEYLPVLVACIVLGLTVNYTNTAAMPLVTESYRTEFRATGLAWVQVIGRLAGIVSPLFIGWLVGLGNDASTVFLWYLIPAVLGIVIVQVMIKRDTKGVSFEELAEE